MSNPRDRTSEFRQCTQSISSRSNPPTASSSSKPAVKRREANKQAASKSEVAKLAAGIAKDINATTAKLQKLAQRELSLI
jgi:syntaxin 5